MHTKFSICSAAAALIGAPPINTFDEGTDVAQKAKETYDVCVESLLTKHPWNFAKEYAVIERDVEEPEAKWDARYNWPNDCLEIRCVYVQDIPIDYEVLGRTVLCNAVNTDTVVAEYTLNIAPSEWPAYFVECVVEKMTSYLASGHAERAALAKVWLDNHNGISLPFARTADSQKQTAARMPRSRRLIGRR